MMDVGSQVEGEEYAIIGRCNKKMRLQEERLILGKLGIVIDQALQKSVMMFLREHGWGLT